jgi:hypothetical protein
MPDVSVTPGAAAISLTAEQAAILLSGEPPQSDQESRLPGGKLGEKELRQQLCQLLFAVPD